MITARYLRRGALSLLTALAEGPPSLTRELANAVDFRALRARVTSEYERYAADRDKRAEELHGTVLRVLKRDAARAAAEKAAQRGTVAASAAVTDGDTPLMTFRSEETFRDRLLKETDAHIAALQDSGGDDTRLREAFRAYTLLKILAEASPERARAAAKPPPFKGGVGGSSALVPKRMMSREEETFDVRGPKMLDALSKRAYYTSDEAIDNVPPPLKPADWYGPPLVAPRDFEALGEETGEDIFTPSEVDAMPWLRVVNEKYPPPSDEETAALAEKAKLDALAFDRAAKFFEKQLLSIDVRRPNGPSHKVLFPMPTAVQYLPPSFKTAIARSFATFETIERTHIEISLRADAISSILSHRHWLATATLPALLSFLAPALRIALLINCILLNLIAATAIEYNTNDGKPHWGGSALLIPLLALGQLAGAVAMLGADSIEFGPQAVEERWCSLRVDAALRDRSEGWPERYGVPGPIVEGTKPVVEGSGDLYSKYGSDVFSVGAYGERRFVLPGWAAHCADFLWRRCFPVQWSYRGLAAIKRVIGLIADGRVRAADGFPEHQPLAVMLRSGAKILLAASEPQLLYGLAVLLCTLPAVLIRPSTPTYLAIQLLLLIASRSDGAREIAATLLSPWPQLFAIIILGAGLLYIHAAFAYYFFGETLSGIPCDSESGLGGCVAASFTGAAFMPYGWPGVQGDAARGTSPMRLLIDVSCYVSVCIVTLGSLLATMLEAFELSSKAKAGATLEVKDMCLICGLTRAEAERTGQSLSTYSPFEYILYLLYVRGKKAAGESLSALEGSVERRAAALDTSWFPRHGEIVDVPAEQEMLALDKGRVVVDEHDEVVGGEDWRSNELARAMRKSLGMDPL